MKRKRILSYLKQHNIDIAVLQETHLTDNEHAKLKQGGCSYIFFSSYTSQARGVAILLHKNVPFQVISVIKDPFRRFVIVQGLLHSEPITLVDIYGLNTNNPQFFEKLFFTFIGPIHRGLHGRRLQFSFGSNP